MGTDDLVETPGELDLFCDFYTETNHKHEEWLLLIYNTICETKPIYW